MGDPLVIGLDSSTQSTKAIAWDPKGRSVAEGRAPIPLSNPGLDRYEQDPNDWWISAGTALRACMDDIDPSRVAGLAISNQRETVAFLDAGGEPVHPAMVWLDERARSEIDGLADRIGGDLIHRITGRMPDTTPCLYRLEWMRRHARETFDRTACFADVQTVLVRRLCGGPFRTGWISADPMGLFDLTEKCWSAPILDALGLDEGRLPEVHPPGTELGRVSTPAAAATGLPPGTPVFAAGGDGQLAGLGTGCTRSNRAYINMGTALVSGVWSADYRYDRAWRTEIAAQGDGYILENCLRSGAFLLNWFVDNFVPGGRGDPSVFDRLEGEAAALPIGSDGVMVLPYWSGVMDPHWDVSARGVVLGLGGDHRPAHVYRAIIEGMTLNQAIGTAALEAASGFHIDHFVAIGGGAHSPLWRQMLADVVQKPVLVSDTVEASALGAGMIAAAGAGWYGSIVEAAQAMAGQTRSVDPNATTGRRYGALLDIYRSVYAATAETNRRLVAFAREPNP
ncbi:MAG: FGGY-family carbohydrate kinase [Inquilinaceae bacterium]